MMDSPSTNNVPVAPGFGTRWLQGFLASMKPNLKFILLASAAVATAFAFAYYYELLSLRSIIFGLLAGAIFNFAPSVFEGRRVASNPFAVHEYLDWVRDRELDGVDMMKQDWCHWYVDTKPQYRYKMSVKQVAKYTQEGVS